MGASKYTRYVDDEAVSDYTVGDVVNFNVKKNTPVNGTIVEIDPKYNLLDVQVEGEDFTRTIHISEVSFTVV